MNAIKTFERNLYNFCTSFFEGPVESSISFWPSTGFKIKVAFKGTANWIVDSGDFTLLNVTINLSKDLTPQVTSYCVPFLGDDGVEYDEDPIDLTEALNILKNIIGTTRLKTLYDYL